MKRKGNLANVFRRNRRRRDSNIFVRKLVVVAPSESHDVHLVAITERGIRFYFTTYPDPRGGWYTTSAQAQRTPQALRMFHVRMPPPYTKSQEIQQESVKPLEHPLFHPTYSKCLDSQVAFYSHGVLLLPHANRGLNSIVAITPHPATLPDLERTPAVADFRTNAALTINGAAVGSGAFTVNRQRAHELDKKRLGQQETVTFVVCKDAGARQSQSKNIKKSITLCFF